MDDRNIIDHSWNHNTQRVDYKHYRRVKYK